MAGTEAKCDPGINRQWSSGNRRVQLPRSNRMVPEWGRDVLREIIVDKRYRVMYRIRPESIDVIGVIDTKQDPKKLAELLPQDL